MSKAPIFVSWPMVETALRSTNPPLLWSKESLVRIGRRDGERLPHVRAGSRQAEVYWDKTIISEFVRVNTIKTPALYQQFVSALDAAITEANNTPRNRENKARKL